MVDFQEEAYDCYSIESPCSINTTRTQATLTGLVNAMVYPYPYKRILDWNVANAAPCSSPAIDCVIDFNTQFDKTKPVEVTAKSPLCTAEDVFKRLTSHFVKWEMTQYGPGGSAWWFNSDGTLEYRSIWGGIAVGLW